MATHLDIPILSCCPPGCENSSALHQGTQPYTPPGFNMRSPRIWMTQSFLLHICRGDGSLFSEGWNVEGAEDPDEVARLITIRSVDADLPKAWKWLSLKSPGWIIKYDSDNHGNYRWKLIGEYHNDGFMQLAVWPD